MKASKTERGFICVEHEVYPPTSGGVPRDPKAKQLIQESSAVGDYEDSFDKPGSSYLWVGEDHHLNREEVAELVERMTIWLRTGRLETEEKRRRRLAQYKVEQPDAQDQAT